jgi:hypothetical protein
MVIPTFGDKKKLSFREYCNVAQFIIGIRITTKADEREHHWV